MKKILTQLEMFTFDNISEEKKKKIVAEMKQELKNGERYKFIDEAHRDVLGRQTSNKFKKV